MDRWTLVHPENDGDGTYQGDNAAQMNVKIPIRATNCHYVGAGPADKCVPSTDDLRAGGDTEN